MQLFMAYAIVGVFFFSLLVLLKKPQVALALFLGLYASEQILIANISFFAHNTEIYNFVIGGVGAASIVISVLKWGFPKFEVSITIIFSMLLLLTVASLSWTPAPIAGKSAVVHFLSEGVLGFLLPFFLIRREEDFYIVIWVTVMYSLITVLSLIFSPLIGSGGRILLVEGGTVLSPATLVGSSIILLAGVSREKLGVLYHGKFFILVILMIGCYISGARTQFFVSVALAGLIILLAQKKSNLILPVIISSIFLYIAASLFLPSTLELATDAASGRYSSDAFESGFNERFEMLNNALENKKILTGHGVMGWAYWVTGRDTYIYPHNSLAQIYFELGIVGFLLFSYLVVNSVYKGVKLYLLKRKLKSSSALSASILGFLVFSFILSLKQGTFMSCTNVYIAVSLVSVWYKLAKKEQRYR